MRYFDTYLPRHDLYYDQRWAMAALTSVCRQGGTGVPDRYLAAWDQWQAATSAGSCDQTVDVLDRVIAFADQVHRAALARRQ